MVRSCRQSAEVYTSFVLSSFNTIGFKFICPVFSIQAFRKILSIFFPFANSSINLSRYRAF